MEKGDQRSFFDHLNYDTRMAIYNYMTLPPFSDGNDCKGFILSCRQAQSEMTETAARHLKSYIIDFKGQFKQVTGHDIDISEIPLYEGFNALKCITVTLPIMALENTSFDRLYPLLKRRLDKVTFMFKGDATAAQQIWIMSNSYTAPTSMYTHVKHPKMPWLPKLAEAQLAILRHAKHRYYGHSYYKNQENSAKEINVKTIVMAWDLTNTTAEDAKSRRQLLKGHYYEYSMTEKWRVRCWNKEGVPNSHFPTRYELMGKGGLLGECGLSSETRWTLLGDSYRKLLRPADRKSIGSDGIGKEFS